MPSHDNLILDGLDSWAPDWPRRASRQQNWVNNPLEAVRILKDAEDDGGNEPYISTYSFPNGHTNENNLPCINTLFIDFDIDDGEYERGSGNREAWRRDLSELLVRARRVAEVLEGTERAQSWRASLSGHKGIHLFLDFPALPGALGGFRQYVNGLNDYAEELVDQLADETGLQSLHDYVDVTSSDLGRLCRAPNTLHQGATDSFGEPRYCVPVGISELAGMTPHRYERLTRSPRDVPQRERSPNQDVHEVIVQHIRMASSGTGTYTTTEGNSSYLDWSRVERHERESNDNLTLQDAQLLTSDMPCVWRFHERDDKFEHGNQSHEMESHCIAKLASEGFPIEVIKEFFANADSYDEQYTERRIRELIARDFNPYRIEKILQRAPEFTGYDDCARCQEILAENDNLSV